MSGRPLRGLLALPVCLAACGGPGLCGDGFADPGVLCLGDPASVPTGVAPFAVVAADLDLDGDIDIAVTAAATDELVVLAGDDAGGLSPAQALAVGDNPVAVIAADVNGDGAPDLLTADAGAGALSLVLGDGAGALLPARAIPVGPAPSSLAVADANGDGVPDVLATTEGAVQVLLGNGDGTFAAPQGFAVDAFARSLLAADFDQDGALDLAIFHEDEAGAGGLTTLSGNGDGTFPSLPAVSQLQGLFAGALADLDGNGQLDIAGVSLQRGVLQELFGVSETPGTSVFAIPNPVLLGGNLHDIKAGDFNADGRPDLAVIDTTSGGLLLLLTNDDAGFLGVGPIAIGSAPRSIAVADLNADEVPDLVTANEGSGDLTVILSIP